MPSILHVGYFHRYDDSRIVYKECRALKEYFDCEVCYVTTNRNGETDLKQIEGIKIRVIPTTQKRFVRLINYIKTVKALCEKDPPDICHIHEFVLWPLVRSLKKKNVKVFLDMHENDIFDKAEMIERKFGKKTAKLALFVLKKLEKMYVEMSDGVISVTPQIIDRVSCYNVPVELIANFPKTSEAIKEKSFEEINKNRDVMCFAGGVSNLWGINTLIKTLEKCPGTSLLLAGRGDKDYIESLSQKDGWEHVTYFGVISHSDVIEKVYKKSGIGMALLTCKDSWLGTEGTLGNTKIFEFMQAGLPVIGTDFSIWKEILLENNCGVVVDPNDVDQVIDAVKLLRNNPQLAFEMGKNGQKAIREKYNWEIEGKKLISFYEKNGGINK